MSLDVIPVGDPRDRRVALGATGRMRELNLAGVLTAADVHVAQRLGRLGGEHDDDVLLAAALAVRAVRGGSVRLDLSQVAEVAPGLPWPAAEQWFDKVQASPLAGTALRCEDGTVYLDRYWREETAVVEELRRRAAQPPPAPPPGSLTAALQEHFPDEAYADQREAARTACLGWTTVMTGGPGTGKTTTVARLLGVLLELSEQPLRVALAAPTGKAAARMAQAVREATHQPGFPGADPGDPAYPRVQRIRQLEATTLHRLLGSRPDTRTRFRHHRGNRLPHDVVVVDETSMVSLTLMARLLEAVRPSARVVLVGDADQLASVEAGAVLKDLVDGYAAVHPDAGRSPVARLTRTRRFGEAIGGLAEAVRRGDPDEVLDRLATGDQQVSWSGEETLPELLRSHAVALHHAAAAGDRATALTRFEAHRLLCAHREGPYGVGHWNRRVERLLMEATGRDWLPEWYAGRPLVVNANDYGLGLFNGDTGVVCQEPDGALVAAVADGATTEGKAMATTRLADVSTAHAMTVHRSQGSQFDEVTVVLPEPGSRVLTRELFYTAVTRARSAVRVVGTEEAVRAAVERQAQRATGLARRLSGS